jgi:hypothetical protein
MISYAIRIAGSRKTKAMRDGIQLSEAITGNGACIFRHACSMGLEGIVSKRIGSPCVSGRTTQAAETYSLRPGRPSRRPFGRWRGGLGCALRVTGYWGRASRRALVARARLLEYIYSHKSTQRHFSYPAEKLELSGSPVGTFSIEVAASI